MSFVFEISVRLCNELSAKPPSVRLVAQPSAQPPVQLFARTSAQPPFQLSVQLSAHPVPVGSLFNLVSYSLLNPLWHLVLCVCTSLFKSNQYVQTPKFLNLMMHRLRSIIRMRRLNSMPTFKRFACYGQQTGRSTRCKLTETRDSPKCTLHIYIVYV